MAEAVVGVNFDGPCATHGAGFDFGPVWRANSVDSGGNDYCYPRTRVHFIFGGQDLTNMPNHGRTYEHAPLTHGSPMVSEQVVADMGQSRAGERRRLGRPANRARGLRPSNVYIVLRLSHDDGSGPRPAQ